MTKIKQKNDWMNVLLMKMKHTTSPKRIYKSKVKSKQLFGCRMILFNEAMTVIIIPNILNNNYPTYLHNWPFCVLCFKSTALVTISILPIPDKSCKLDFFLKYTVTLLFFLFTTQSTISVSLTSNSFLISKGITVWKPLYIYSLK